MPEALVLPVGAPWATEPTDLELLRSGDLIVLGAQDPAPYDPWCDAPTFLPPRQGD